MLRLTWIALLLASASAAQAQFFQPRAPLTIFEPNNITTIQPTPNGFFAYDLHGNMASRNGNMIMVTPAPLPPLQPMQPIAPMRPMW